MNTFVPAQVARITAIGGAIAFGSLQAQAQEQPTNPTSPMATQVTSSTFTQNAVMADIELNADPSSALMAKGGVGFAGINFGAEYTKTVTSMVPRVRAASTYIRPGSTVSGTTANLSAQLKSIKLNGGTLDAAVLEIGPQ